MTAALIFPEMPKMPNVLTAAGRRVARLIAHLISTPASGPNPCACCGRVGDHADWCARAVRP